MIYHQIESALSEWCNVGNMSMWAYVDEEKGHWSGKGEFLRKKTWESKIYFLPGGELFYKNTFFLYISYMYVIYVSYICQGINS